MGRPSTIVAFYAGEGTDHRGRSLKEIWAWEDDRLEDVHDYIQWLFPLNEGSMFNAAAPILTAEEINAFSDSPALRKNLHRSFERILAFYGFILDETGATPIIAPGPQFQMRAIHWMTPGNHNFLRLTRIMKSLMLLGVEPLARVLFQALEKLHAGESGKTIGPRTLQFWRDAVGG